MASERIKKVCDLVITRGALAGRGNNDDAARGVCLDDAFDFFELRGIRKGASAEFGDDHGIECSFVVNFCLLNVVQWNVLI